MLALMQLIPSKCRRDDNCMQDALDDCDLFITVGTSSAVYPAAGFASQVRQMIYTTCLSHLGDAVM